jgi:predicted lipoprotein
MINREKFEIAINILKSKVEYTYDNDAPVTEELFNKIKWKTGEDIETTICPHSEITWAKLKEEMDKIQVDYDAQDYARKREAEYPKIGDQLDKIYHEGIDTWKADMITPIKNKYPKG